MGSLKLGDKAKAVAVPTPASMVFESCKDAIEVYEILMKRFSGLTVTPVKVHGKWALQFDLLGFHTIINE